MLPLKKLPTSASVERWPKSQRLLIEIIVDLFPVFLGKLKIEKMELTSEDINFLGTEEVDIQADAPEELEEHRK